MKCTMNSVLAHHWHTVTALLVAGIFFLMTGLFVAHLHGGGFAKFASPDESANYFFARHYAETGQLSFFEPRNVGTGDLIRTRSIRSDNGTVKPVSFLGLPLIYGTLGSLVGVQAIPYLTPLFGSLGILFFYFFLARLFGKSAALLSALLLAVFPAYLYYTAHSMYHNVLFFAFLAGGLAAAVRTAGPTNTRTVLASIFAGISFGLALSVRTSELLWLGPVLGIIAIIFFKRVGLVRITLATAALFVSLLPVLSWNTALYGAPLSGGYPQMNNSIHSVRTAPLSFAQRIAAGEWDAIREEVRTLKKALFPFGINIPLAADTLTNYLVHMFPWLVGLGTVGLIGSAALTRGFLRRHAAYLLSALTLSIILVVYYGSWKFHDNPDATAITIGNSYTRYWLPIYAALLPFAAISILAVAHMIASRMFPSRIGRIAQGTVVALALLIIGSSSVRFVLAGSEEGLLEYANRHEATRAEYASVLNATEADAIIITRYHDKLFFPERAVIVGLFDDSNMIRYYAMHAQRGPVYYYNFTLPEKDFVYLKERRLPAFGLNIEPTDVTSGQFTLYRLSVVSQKK